MNERHDSGISAFTLIELLAVIAIISLLLSILLPSLSRAREMARKANCGANLHHLGIAWQMYASDNGDVVVPARDYSGSDGYACKFWSGACNDNKEFYPERGFLQAYTDLRIRGCPSWVIHGEANYGAIGIGYNWRYLSPGGWDTNDEWTFDWTPLSQITHPAITMAFADVARNNWRVLPEDLIETSQFIQPPSYGYPAFHGRHNGAGNVAWCDGHVSSEKPVILCEDGELYWNNGYTPIPVENVKRHKIGDLDGDMDPNTDEFFAPNKHGSSS